MQVRLQYYYKISCEENGDIDFWIPMFDQFLRCEVNSSGLDTTRFFGGFNNSQFSEAEMVYGFDYRCALAKMLPEVLDTEGCISCSRKLRSRHGCLDQGFDPFEGNGTTRHLGKLWSWCHFFHVVIWAEFYPNANEVSSPDLSKPKWSQPRWLVLFMQIILDVVKSHVEVIEIEIYHSWYCWRVHCMTYWMLLEWVGSLWKTEENGFSFLLKYATTAAV